MRLFVLTAVVLVAFAANSVLTRAGLLAGGIDVAGFGIVRLWSGAVMLVALAVWQGQALRLWTWRRGISVAGLVLYIYGFTAAYVDLDAGLGALLLFGTVQVTMFAAAVVLREEMPVLRTVGAVVALAGLVYLVWPWRAIASTPGSVMAMGLAGVGWGIYSLAGRGSTAPLADTGVNFAVAGVVFPALWFAFGGGVPEVSPGAGAWLAVASGALASGLGYALWFAVLPRLDASVAAVTQLMVPPIALAGGIVFLGEALTAKFLVAALVILGGVALSVLGPRYFTRRSRGS